MTTGAITPGGGFAIAMLAVMFAALAFLAILVAAIIRNARQQDPPPEAPKPPKSRPTPPPRQPWERDPLWWKNPPDEPD